MAFTSVLFGCFSDKSTESKVGCDEGEGECQLAVASEHKHKLPSPQAEAAASDVAKSNKKTSKPPIPMTYFPVGSRFSVL